VGTQQKLRLQDGDVVADRYRIDGVVGRGGFGAVYRAMQLDTGISVALKVLITKFDTHKVDAKRFEREAALVQRLRHPNVVQLLDFGVTAMGQSFIAFELLTGVALGTVLKTQGALPMMRAAEVTRDILSALEAAHELDIIHRDIKPANVFLVDGDGAAKVLDFGIAKVASEDHAGGTQLTEAGQMVGTPHYMAPEQVRGDGILPASDVYSAGLLFAEMIGGERIVAGAGLIDIYLSHIADHPHSLPQAVLDSPVVAVIQRAIAKAVEQRYQTATEMMVDLTSALPELASGVGSGPDAYHRSSMDLGAGAVAAGPMSAAPTQVVSRGQVPGAAGLLSVSSTIMMDSPDDEIAHFQRDSGVAALNDLAFHPSTSESDVLNKTLSMTDGPASAGLSSASPVAQTGGGPPESNASQRLSGTDLAELARRPSSNPSPYQSGEHHYRFSEPQVPGAIFPNHDQQPFSSNVGLVILLIVGVVLTAIAVGGVLVWAPWDARRGFDASHPWALSEIAEASVRPAA